MIPCISGTDKETFEKAG